jgi:Tfp pilus tip-associated adhesin PilY1
MKSPHFHTVAPGVGAGLISLACALAALWPAMAPAAITELANNPISSTQTAAAKPNIMVLMDASRSMQATHMPDDLEFYNEDDQRIGYRSSQCNPLYFNPASTYVLPKVVDTADAALPLISAPTPVFAAARYNYYDASDASVVNLGSAFQAFDANTRLGSGAAGGTPTSRSDTPQAAYYWVHSSGTPLAYTSAACTQVVPAGSSVAATGGGTWTKTAVSAGQQANFAIWYSYYRTRMALVKSGIGRAFAIVDDKYRVGFITAAPLEPGNATDSNVPPLASASVQASSYQPINDFTAANRRLVYDKLYSQKPAGASPMREGLARVGRHFSDYGNGTVGDGASRSNGINRGMPYDPVQHSCQRNYTIMTTDGYWNKIFETVGAVRMDGTTLVGQQDSPLTDTSLTSYSPRPMFDGGSSGYVTDQRQTYDFQTQLCSSGNSTKVVTSSTQAVDQYLNRTQQQFRQTTGLTRGITQSTKVTTTQTIDTVKLTEAITATQKDVTHTMQTLTSSTQRVTKSTRLIETQVQTVTQVVRNDTQLTQAYQYFRKMVETATMVATTRTMTTVQYKRVDADTGQLVVCASAGLAGCTIYTTTVAVGSALALDLACTNALPTLANDYKTITCSSITTASAVAINPYSTCIGTSTWNAALSRVETCSARTTVVSYAATSGSCTANAGTSSPFTKITCSGALTPTSPVAGAVSSCNPSTNLTSGLAIPADATNQAPSANPYARTCPTSVVTAPVGTTVTNTTTQAYAVDPATCAVTAGSPPTAKTSSSGGLSTTCTPSTTVTNPNFGVCSNVAATSPSWTATVCTVTDNKVAGAAPTISRTTCPATTAAVTSGSTRTTCTLVSDTSSAVATTSCVAGPTYVSATGLTTSCSTAAVSGPTQVVICPLGLNALTGYTSACSQSTPVTTKPVDPAVCAAAAGFNAATGDTTSCTVYTIQAATAVAACTYGTSPYYDPVTFKTYTCSSSTTLGVAVNVGACVAGSVIAASSSNNPLTGTKYTKSTCNAATSVTSYVQTGPAYCTATALTGIKTVVACPATTTIEAVHAVAAGSCTPGTSYVATPAWPTATGGYTTVCANSGAGWVQEAVGTACTGSATAPTYNTGAGWSGVTSTDPVTLAVTTCNMYDSGDVSQSAVCTPGVSFSGQDKLTCTKNAISAAAPAAPCSTGFYVSGGQNYYQTCSSTPVSTTVATASCTENAAAVAPDWTTTTCTPIADAWQLQSRYSTANWRTSLSGTTLVGSAALNNTVGPSAWQNVGACTPDVPATPRPLAADLVSVEASVGVPMGHAAAPVGATGPTVLAPLGLTTNSISEDAVTHVISVGGAGACANWACNMYTAGTDTGSSNSLADVAQYYYSTDLRSGLANELLSTPAASAMHWEDDRATHQHMSTYVVGLGVSGTLAFDQNYRSLANTLGDFPAIRSGAKSWPVWPTAAVEASTNPSVFSDPRSIDDFWHAAVNGRGQYFSAADAYTMVSGIQGALNSINALIGAGGGATTSTASPTATDNAVFVPGFKLKAWTGDVQARSFDIASVSVTSTSQWSAQTQLESMVAPSSDTRKIVFRKSGSNAWAGWTDMAQFNYANLDLTQKTYFGAASVAALSQYASMTPTQVTNAKDDNLVNFLRGQRGYEDFSPGALLYRKREAVLGDIVGSQPIYVKAPAQAYADSTYDAFKALSAVASRKKMVYAGANDGMLHAFYAPATGDSNVADGGKEAWAYVPSQMLPTMYKLADVQYSGNHLFYVDGTVTVGDACASPCSGASSWHTILVGGFNAGGKGYYALDITDPDKPKSLWEFTTAQDANVGLSFGRPIISKLADGTWTVMFTSGYNNADGGGYLYVVNALTGAVIKTMSTGAGSAGSPSGLREINNWVNNVSVDNTTQRIYGGDLLGNVWRFEVNDAGNTGAGLKLATLTTGGITPTAQPITARMELAEIGGDPYVFAGTGRLLGNTDLADTQVQSVYSFKDINGYYPLGDVRSSLKPMAFTGSLVNGARTAACTGTATQCSKKSGWVIDLPESGERMNIDFKAGMGTLVFVTNVPAGDVCSDGHSWFNYLDMVSGEQVSGSANASVVLAANSLGVGLTLVALPSSSGSSPALWALGSGARGEQVDALIPTPPPAPMGKRVSWREVVQ